MMIRAVAPLAAIFAALIVLAASLCAGNALAQTPPTSTGADAPAPQLGKPAPDFTLNDLTGKPRSLSALQKSVLKGRPVALFFFCGCESCYSTAREWASALPSVNAVQPGTPKPQTIIVYTEMSAKSARSLSQSAGLTEKNALFLLDPDLTVSRDRYRAEPCPRVFVLSPTGLLRYTNSRISDQPPAVPASLLVAKIVDALQVIR